MISTLNSVNPTLIILPHALLYQGVVRANIVDLQRKATGFGLDFLNCLAAMATVSTGTIVAMVPKEGEGEEREKKKADDVTMTENPAESSALNNRNDAQWFGTARNRDVSTGPLACPFACSFVTLACLLAHSLPSL